MAILEVALLSNTCFASQLYRRKWSLLIYTRQGFDSRRRTQYGGKYQRPETRIWQWVGWSKISTENRGQQLMVPPHDVLHVVSC